jgi:hypothetical protein
MDIRLQHHGKIENGRITFYNPELYSQHLTELEGKEIVFIMKEKHKKPSNNQYSYYRGIILLCCYQSEMFSHFDNKDDIHSNYFAQKYLSYITKVQLKNEYYEIKKVKSLADITEKEMSVFIEKVLMDCAENGIIILSPEESFNNRYK